MPRMNVLRALRSGKQLFHSREQRSYLVLVFGHLKLDNCYSTFSCFDAWCNRCCSIQIIYLGKRENHWWFPGSIPTWLNHEAIKSRHLSEREYIWIFLIKSGKSSKILPRVSVRLTLRVNYGISHKENGRKLFEKYVLPKTHHIFHFQKKKRCQNTALKE